MRTYMTVYGVDIVHVYADLFSLVIEVRTFKTCLELEFIRKVCNEC